MSIVYTLNGKVLKNAANDKWLAKKSGPIFDSVTIGTQTWKKYNLAVNDGGEGISQQDNVTINGVDLGTQYYYKWDAAVRVANTIEGWHLPSKAEWETLITYVGGIDIAGTKLKSTTGWNNSGNGDDSYGLSVFPTGSVNWSEWILGLGSEAHFWTSTQNGSNYAYEYYFNTDTAMIMGSTYKTEQYYSIRLVKDS